MARRKPPISEKNRRARLAWAEAHRNWTFDQWALIFWTDETWATGGRHTRTWVTRRPGEEWDPTCIVERHQRKGGWMFWGGFNGTNKGPGIFWEKDWGSINMTSFTEHIVPIIHEYFDDQAELGNRLVLMQDGAPGHSGSITQANLRLRGIETCHWPAFSPDLNPIEAVWNWMKDYIEEHFPEKLGYVRLKEAVREAWHAVPEQFFSDLLHTMNQRCEDVIAANGMHTRW